jgi:hypothetical protein
MRTDPPFRGSGKNQEGFALALVVLLLFAIAVAGATGYQVVSTEAFQSQQSAETTQALAVAQGGLDWFIGAQRGLVPDTATYNINGGIAVITTRKVATLSTEEDLYLVRSEGTFTDRRYPQIPAVRVASQYAVYKKVPFNVFAPVLTTSNLVRVMGLANVDGSDHAYAGQCAGAPTAPQAGVAARSNIQTSGGGVISGDPPGLPLGNFDTVVDSVGLAWDVYGDPTFPVDFDDTWPNFASLPGDSFPVIRRTGDFSPNWTRSGRGVLIVTGTLMIPDFSFWYWNGIVVAGDLQDVGQWGFWTLEGAMVAGQGSAMSSWDMENGDIDYQSCYVTWAGRSLAHLSKISGSWWEEG